MTSTRTIDALLEIMADTDIVTRRRIEAAEALLNFEAPEAAVVRAREFLIEVFENKEESIADRMDALKATRKSEAPKVTPKIVHLNRRTEVDRKEAWRAYEKAQLKKKIVAATNDTPPPGWCDILMGDDYLPPPEGWPPWYDKDGRRR
jgi:hypothetical protein